MEKSPSPNLPPTCKSLCPTSGRHDEKISGILSRDGVRGEGKGEGFGVVGHSFLACSFAPARIPVWSEPLSLSLSLVAFTVFFLDFRSFFLSLPSFSMLSFASFLPQMTSISNSSIFLSYNFSIASPLNSYALLSLSFFRPLESILSLGLSLILFQKSSCCPQEKWNLHLVLPHFLLLTVTTELQNHE